VNSCAPAARRPKMLRDLTLSFVVLFHFISVRFASLMAESCPNTEREKYEAWLGIYYTQKGEICHHIADFFPKHPNFSMQVYKKYLIIIFIMTFFSSQK